MTKKRVVITGASDGLGLEIAKLYKASGIRVVNISRTACSAADDNLLYDLSIAANISKATQDVLSSSDPIEAVIHCIGVWGEESMNAMTDEATELLLATNLKAPMLLSSGLLERIRSDEADVVNVVSTAGLKGNKRHSAYVASKWGQRGFTDSLREELGDTPCRVIGFYPGGMKTKLFEKDLGNDITDDGSYWMDPAEVAKCLKQLLDLPKGIEVSDITLNRKKSFE